MRRGDLAGLTAFAAVADARNFRGAAARLGITPSALSHAIRQLEAKLGVRLLNRTTRSVSLTDAGRRLLERIWPALRAIGEAVDDLGGERDRPVGQLRLLVTHMAAAAVVAPIWSRFLAAYPEVALELWLEDGTADIVARGFDAGVAPRDRIPEDMIAVQVMRPMKVAVVGAPSYFAQHAPPRAPGALLRHQCIQYRRIVSGQIMTWRFERNGRALEIAPTGRFTVNDPDIALRAAVDGLGITYSLDALVEPFLRSGQLVRVLEEWSPAFEGLFLYHASRRQLPPALRALIDAIQAIAAGPKRRSDAENPFSD